MIPSIGRTILAAQSWPTMNLAELARSLSGPFNDDYNQFHSCYQCHGSPLGRVYVNTPWPAVCFDVDNEVMYLKQDLAISHNGWQSAVVPPVNDPVFDNLTHYWSMDEASGTRADSKGSINLDEVGGAVSSGTGKFGSAVNFNTAGRYLTTSSNLIPDNESVSFWVYLRSWPTPGNTFTLISDDTVPNALVRVNEFGQIQFSDDADEDGYVTTSLGALNTWHLVVCVAGFISNTQSLSVDGGNFVTGIGVNSFAGGLGLHFGCDCGGATLVPDGLIDEVAAWNSYDLTQADVTTLWNGGAGTFYRP